MATAISPPNSQPSPYPFAAAPDIIRAHQKDAYFQGTLANTLSSLHRRLLGARSAHVWTAESRTAASLLYLALTTAVGNRTLGEEYCDVVQIQTPSAQLPSALRRGTYIISSVLLPYTASRLVPKFRSRLRAVLEARLSTLISGQRGDSSEARIWRYLLAHLGTITSGAPIHALALATFYFSGTYYELAKRILGLRYVFTRKMPDTPDRVGYEVLGVLLVVQLAVQTFLHVRSVASHSDREQRERIQLDGGDVTVSLDGNVYSSNNELLLPNFSGGRPGPRVDLSVATHTPALGSPRYDLQDGGIMAFIKGQQQRKCTLCLEQLKDPAATQCGHVFCWVCISDWIGEKPECPLCRRDAMVQHVLPLRAL